MTGSHFHQPIIKHNALRIDASIMQTTDVSEDSRQRAPITSLCLPSTARLAYEERIGNRG